MNREKSINIAKSCGLFYKNKNVDKVFSPDDEIDTSRISDIPGFALDWFVCNDKGIKVDFNEMADNIAELSKKHEILTFNSKAIAEHIRRDDLKDPNSIDNKLEYIRSEIVDLQMNGISKIALGFISVASLIISIIALCIK